MDIFLILWSVAGGLFILVIFQIIYLVFLGVLPTKRRERGTRLVAPTPSAGNSPFADLSPAYAGNPAVQSASSAPHVPPPTPIASIPTPMPTPSPRTAQPAPVAIAAPPQAQVAPAPLIAPPPAIPIPNIPVSSTGGGNRKLIVLAGLPELFEINLPGNDFGIGRFFNQERKVLVMFDEKSISREHALFAYNPQLDQYFITDKSSSYGTYVLVDNKFEPLTPERPERIFNGDVVQFGNAVKVRFILPGETRASMTSL